MSFEKEMILELDEKNLPKLENRSIDNERYSLENIKWKKKSEENHSNRTPR